jgi:hypothetical protein
MRAERAPSAPPRRRLTFTRHFHSHSRRPRRRATLFRLETGVALKIPEATNGAFTCAMPSKTSAVVKNHTEKVQTLEVENLKLAAAYQGLEKSEAADIKASLEELEWRIQEGEHYAYRERHFNAS